MPTKEKVHNLIILDESGSMQSIKEVIISGFNELVQSVKSTATEFPEQEHFISFISFNSRDIKTHLDVALTSSLEEINKDNYRPSAMTPLFDAMGQGINRLRAQINDRKNTNVLVTILTDGLENASKEYDKRSIKSLVEEMEKEKWTFTYIGTDHDVDSFAKSISIKNTMSFHKSRKGVSAMFDKEKRSRQAYYSKIRDKRDASQNFYMDED